MNKSTMKKLLITLLCAGALFAADVNRRAPGFSIVDSKGEEHDLADYRGKLVLLFFMQTTCPHCANFAELLQQTQEKYGSRIAVVAVAIYPDDPGKVKDFVAGHRITYPVLLDIGQVAYSYVLTKTLDFPHLYMIDASGIIRRDYLYGPLTREIFEGDRLAAEIARMLPAGAPEKK
jgi:peroxiredoxin